MALHLALTCLGDRSVQPHRSRRPPPSWPHGSRYITHRVQCNTPYTSVHTGVEHEGNDDLGGVRTVYSTPYWEASKHAIRQQPPIDLSKGLKALSTVRKRKFASRGRVTSCRVHRGPAAASLLFSASSSPASSTPPPSTSLCFTRKPDSKVTMQPPEHGPRPAHPRPTPPRLFPSWTEPGQERAGCTPSPSRHPAESRVFDSFRFVFYFFWLYSIYVLVLPFPPRLLSHVVTEQEKTRETSAVVQSARSERPTLVCLSVSVVDDPFSTRSPLSKKPQ